MNTQFDNPHNKLQVMLSSQELGEQSKATKQKHVVAKMMLANLKKGPDWLKAQAIKTLYLYKDIPEVISTLQELQAQEDTSESIKNLIRDFFAGDIDVSDFMRQRKRLAKLKSKIDETRQKNAAKESQMAMEKSNISAQLGLLQMKM